MATNTTQRKSTTGKTTAKTADFTVRLLGGRYKVFDKQGKFRVSFASQAEAEHYIDEHRQPRRIVLTPAP